MTHRWRMIIALLLSVVMLGIAAPVALGQTPAKAHTLTADFATYPTWLTNDGAASIQNVNGETRLRVGANTGYSGMARQTTVSDLNESQTHVRLSEVTGPGNGTTETVFELNNSADTGYTANRLQFVLNNNQMRFSSTVNGTTTSTSAGYDLTNFRWLRFREAGTSLYFETAPDGANASTPGTWTTRRTITSPSWVGTVQHWFFAGHWGTEAPGSYAEFDHLNLPSAPAPNPTPTPTPTPTDGPPMSGTLLWTGDHEEGSLVDWDLNGGGGEFNSDGADAWATTTQKRSGSYGMEMSHPCVDCHQGTRMFRWGEVWNNRHVIMDQYYYFPEHVTVNNWWMIWETKARANNDGRNDATWSLMVTNPSPGVMRPHLFWRGGASAIDGPYAGMGQQDINYQLGPAADLKVGQWNRVTFEMRQASDTSGRIVVWINGNKVAEHNNVRTGYYSSRHAGIPGHTWMTDQGMAIVNYGQNIRSASGDGPHFYVDDVTIRRVGS